MAKSSYSLSHNHIHMLVVIPPKISISSFMGYLKGKSSLMIFNQYANLKCKYGNRKFWAEGSKTKTEYLEHKIIQDFKTKSDFELTNLNNGNTSYRGKLQKLQATALYKTVFEISEDIASLNFFGGETYSYELKQEEVKIDKFVISYDK